MSGTMSQRCPTFNVVCYLPDCNSTGRCKHAAQTAGANPVTDASHISASPHSPPDKVQCDYPDGQCRREDCEEACRCRMGFARDFRTLSQVAKTFASGTATSASGTAASGTNSVYGRTTPQCHSGWNYVGSIGQAHIWLGREGAFTSNRTQVDRPPIALALDLTDLGRKSGEPTPLVAVSASAAPFAAHLAVQGTAPIPRIDIAWPDYGVPPLSREWWDKLVATLRDNVVGDVVIYCVGGHGRTGTCASILSVLGGFLPADQPCPVSWLRAIYCHEVVESQKQIDYIERMTGVKPAVSGAKEADNWTSYWQAHDDAVADRAASAATASAQGSFPFKPKHRKPTPTLSNNAYRRLIRDAKRAGGAELTALKDLQDGEELEYDGAIWAWDKEDNRWVYVEEVGGEDEQDAPATHTDNPPQSQSLPEWPYAKDSKGDPMLSNPVYIDLRMEMGVRPSVGGTPPPPLGDLTDGYFCSFAGRLFHWNATKKVWDYNSISLNPPAAILKVWWAKT